MDNQNPPLMRMELKGYKSHLDTVIDFDWITSIVPKDLKRPNDIGKCCHVNDRIFLADGSCPTFGELVGQTRRVWSYSSMDTLEEPIACDAHFTDNGTQEVYEITLEDGTILRRTSDHPLWAGRTLWKDNSKPTLSVETQGWVQPCELTLAGAVRQGPGHVLLVPIDIPEPHQPFQLQMRDEDIKMCAILLAEGSIGGTYTGFTSASSEIVEVMRQAVANYDCKLSQDTPIQFRVVKNVKSLAPNPVTQLTAAWGIRHNAKEKRVPEWVFRLPKKQIQIFLAYFLDCDGWVTTYKDSGAVSTALANERLVEDIAILAIRAGIRGVLGRKRVDKQGYVSWKWSSYRTKQIKEMGLVSKQYKLDTLGESIPPRRRWQSQNCPQGFEWRKVVSIEIKRGPTVSIEVDSPTHAFLNWGGIEHNSNLLRGLRMLATHGDWPDRFISWHATSGEASLTMGTGMTVKRVRSKRSQSTHIFSASGEDLNLDGVNNAQQYVEAAVGLRKVQLDEQTGPEDINIVPVGAGRILTGKSAEVVKRRVVGVIGGSVIEDARLAITKQLKDSTKEMEVVSKEVASLETEVEGRAPLIEKFASYLHQAEQIEATLLKEQEVLHIAGELQSITDNELQDCYHSLFNLSLEMSVIEREIFEEEHALILLAQLQDLEKIKIKFPTKKQLSALDKELDELATLVAIAEEFEVGIYPYMDEELVTLNLLAVEVDEEINRAMKNVKLCPTCGQVME